MGGAAGAGGEDPPVNTFVYRDVKVTAFNINGMAAPGFAVTDKYVLLGANVQNVKRAIARLAGESTPGLVDSEQYARAMERLKGAGDFGVLYSDVSATVPSFMATAGLVAGLALPAMERARGAAKGAASASNLRQMGVACQMYAGDNDDKFPPDMKTMVPDYVDNPRLFLSPGYSRHAADGVDYAYVPGLTNADPGDWVVAYETLPGERGRQAVLFIDCHIEQLDAGELGRRLATQKEALAKAKREFKPVEPVGVVRGGPEGLDAGALGEEAFFDLIKSLANPAAMPPPEAITKHLFPSVAAARKTEGGLLFDSFGPLGPISGPGGAESVAGMAIVAAIAIPNLLMARRSSIESNAAASCRAYAGAQTMFKRNDWDGNGVLEYAADFPALCNTQDANGEAIMLLDRAFAQAKGPDGTPKHGYLFYSMETIGGEKINWANDFGLCAVPAEYGKTGRTTFIISTNGTVFSIDNMGKPVTDYPADPTEEGWIIAE
jgi:type II secretory pathway pseudopilin PulG